MAVVDTLANAIYRQEGSAPTDRNNRNNNPGNLWDGSHSIWPNLPHDADGFVIFPTFAAGWNAMVNDLNVKINRGWDLTQILSAWAPPTSNDTASYINNVSGWTGIPASGVPVNSIDPGSLSTVPGSGIDTTSGMPADPTSGTFDINSLFGGTTDLSALGISTPLPFSPLLLLGAGLLLWYLLAE